MNTAYAEFLKRYPHPSVEVEIRAEADELWGYVGEKSNQHWLWYAVERASGIVLAHHIDAHTDAACQCLLDKLSIFPIRTYYTDGWQSYAALIPAEHHQIGKANTWRIERTNLTLRTHIKRLHRKTICFSKNETIHANVIGMYMEHYYYNDSIYEEIA